MLQRNWLTTSVFQRYLTLRVILENKLVKQGVLNVKPDKNQKVYDEGKCFVETCIE